MASSYAAHYIANLEDTTRYRLDEAAKPLIHGKAMAQQLYHGIQAQKAMGNLDRARELAIELKPLLYLLEG